MKFCSGDLHSRLLPFFHSFTGFLQVLKMLGSPIMAKNPVLQQILENQQKPTYSNGNKISKQTKQKIEKRRTLYKEGKYVTEGKKSQR